MSNRSSDKNKFDCVIATCGGIDSLYVLHLVKTEYGLNPLVVTIDNGFLNPEAKRNLNKVIDQLQVKNVYYKLNISRSLYRHFLLETGNFCALCVYSILFHVGRIGFENGIKNLVFGMSKREDAFLPHGYVSFDFLSIIRKHKKEFPEFKLFKKKSFLFLFYYLFAGKVINLPDYIGWDADKNRKFLEKKFSINLEKEHYDCIMHEFANYLVYKKYGFSYVTLKYSKMIRNHKVEREKALEKMIEKEAKEPENMKYFMDYFDITEQDIRVAIENSKVLESKIANKVCQFLRKSYFRRRM